MSGIIVTIVRRRPVPNVEYVDGSGRRRELHLGRREIEVLEFLRRSPGATKYDFAAVSIPLGFAVQRAVCSMRGKGVEIVSTAEQRHLPGGVIVRCLAAYRLAGRFSVLTPAKQKRTA